MLDVKPLRSMALCSLIYSLHELETVHLCYFKTLMWFLISTMVSPSLGSLEPVNPYYGLHST